ncbi:3-oxoacyl-[acyl-carrier-protein] synthase-3 [Laceyella sediminis]|uniref:Beta-ketoacyl-[acyl-carrier-protein] synthase III n=1 Tax=Laceyella sediminis TaxID=573074 RepID=A0ABX5EPH2_9BACL|nr:ketoacyl-ACP synthase III [Laceyella sediminis]PRZ14814.1 3-oxoacyl-[acyl-carrier-protein] synthase-3 [Laceyella sediminis]
MHSLAKITGIGTHVPEERLTNADLERMVDTSDEWIVPRTGIRERRVSAPDEWSSHLAIKAVNNMLARYPVTLDQVDLILVATATPDTTFPSVACQIQDHYGLPDTGALDISAACAGFVYALHLANGMITSGLHRKILVIAAETLTKITDYTDRNTCILLGDGAGAVMVEACPADQASFIHTRTTTDGSAGIHLYKSDLATHIRGKEIIKNGYMIQNGREVFKIAVSTLSREIPRLLEQTEYTLDDIDWFVPHSANLRIIDAVCGRLDFPTEKTLFSAEYFGNTSSASIPLALQMGLDEGKVKQGNLLLLSGFGGGFVHMSSLIRWTASGRRV